METIKQCSIEKESFLRKYNITNETYVDSGCSWKELEAIYTDFEAHTHKAIFTAQAAILELADFDVSYKGTDHIFSKGMQLYLLGKYGIGMLALKEGVFNRAPYTTAIGSWAAGDPVLLKTDLLAVAI